MTKVYWSTWTSASSQRAIAEDFSGPSGVLFDIRTASARNIQPYSALQYEHEFLLGPNSEFTVTDVEVEKGRLVVKLIEVLEAAAVATH